MTFGEAYFKVRLYQFIALTLIFMGVAAYILIKNRR